MHFLKKCLIIVFTIMMIFNDIIVFAATTISDNDGSAFITKAEFDALKSSFQSQIDTYNKSIDSKIDSAIASYLSGIRISEKEILTDYVKLVGNYGSKYVTFNSYDASHSPNDTKNRAGEYTLYNSYGRCYATVTYWDFSINNGNTTRGDVFVPCSTHGKSTHALYAEKIYLNGLEVGYEPVSKNYYSFSHLFNQFSCDMKPRPEDAANYNWNARSSAYAVSFNERVAEYSQGSFNQFGTKINYTKVHCGLYNEDTECGEWVLTLPGGSYKQTNKVASITSDELGFFNGTQYTENIKGPNGWITVMCAGSDSNIQFNWTWYDWKYEYDYPTKWLNAGATKTLSEAVYRYEGLPIFKTTNNIDSVSFKFKTTADSRVVISKKKFTNADLPTTTTIDYIYNKVCTANTEYTVDFDDTKVEDDTMYWVKICPSTVNTTGTINIIGDIEQKLKK